MQSSWMSEAKMTPPISCNNTEWKWLYIKDQILLNHFTLSNLYIHEISYRLRSHNLRHLQILRRGTTTGQTQNHWLHLIRWKQQTKQTATIKSKLGISNVPCFVLVILCDCGQEDNGTYISVQFNVYEYRFELYPTYQLVN
jgi:hypothetical protein